MILFTFEKDSFPICSKCHSSIYFEELPISTLKFRIKDKWAYYGGSLGIPVFTVLPQFALCKIKCLWDCDHEKELAIVPREHRKRINRINKK